MKGVLERLGLGMPKVSAGGEAKRVLNEITDEFVESRRQQNNLQWENVRSLKASPRFVALMEEPEEFQIDVALVALEANKRGQAGGGDWEYWLRRDLPFAVARMILQKKKLVFSDDQIVGLMRRASRVEHLNYQFPVATVLGATERHLAGQRPEGAIRSAIEAFVKRVESEQWPTKAVQKMGARAHEMLSPGTGGLAVPKGAFGTKLQEWAGDDKAPIAAILPVGEEAPVTQGLLLTGMYVFSTLVAMATPGLSPGPVIFLASTAYLKDLTDEPLFKYKFLHLANHG